MTRTITSAAILSLALLAPAAALADPTETQTTTSHAAAPATPPVQVQVTSPAIDSRVVLVRGPSTPVMSPLAPTPKPVLSEGAKAGFIAGGIVVAALIITGVIVLHH